MIVSDYNDVSNLIDNLRPQLLASKDVGLIESVSKLLNVNNKKLDLLTKLALQNKKGKQSKELTEIKNKKIGGNSTQNNFMFIGNREEVLKRLKEGDYLDSGPSEERKNLKSEENESLPSISV
jgi:hypothetical protein